jgi:L-lactate dehydrogenase complex protein LldF
MTQTKSRFYVDEAARGIRNPVLQKSLANLQQRFGRATAQSYLELPEGPELRFKAHDMRMAAVENLDILLETLAENVRKNGGRVHFAENAESARDYCLGVARRHKVRMAVKGKSMVSEEISLNDFLADHDIEAVETDLGEFIVQLADEHPSHIIAPAAHKTKEQIGKLFADKLGIDYIDDPPALTQAARKALRQKFLAADMGITGCNLACAETGHIAIVSNEGNIRMASTLPRVHVAIMGMERVTARLADYDVLFRLLARGAAAQKMPGYVSYVGGPRQPGQADGPDEFHLIILDNGRSRILGDPVFREILGCIRCGACLNVCPVYAKIGGHAYGFAYSGPVGAVVTPLLTGIERAKDLCLGETLCGACQDACPVNLDIPRMLLALRAVLAEGNPYWAVAPSDPLQKTMFKTWALSLTNRKRYNMLLKTAATGQKALPRSGGMMTKLPPPFSGWTQSRDLRPLARESFNRCWKRQQRNS